MRITRGRHLTINMGNYENYKVIAEVTVSHHDLGLSDDDLSQRSPEDNAITAAELQAFVADQLDAALETLAPGTSPAHRG